MVPWDAMVALVGEGLAPAAFPVLAGVPTRAVALYRDLASALRAFIQIGSLPPAAPAAANAALNAYLTGRRVEGDLNLTDLQWPLALPEGLTVTGSVQLIRSGMRSLPADLRVDGDLDATLTKVETLPRGLRVGGSLTFYGCPLQALPDDLHVRGGLNLERTPLTALPKGLRVDGHLSMGKTRVQALPDDLVVKGRIFLAHSEIKRLPAGFKVFAGMTLENTPIAELPKGLTVLGDLDLRDCRNLRRLPAGLKVQRELFLTGSGWDGHLPEDAEVGRLVVDGKRLSAEAWRADHP
jgi:hypothetical protein